MIIIHQNCLFDVQEQITQFYRYVYTILTYRVVNRELVLLELLKSKCSPSSLYGLDVIYFIYIDVKIRVAIIKTYN